MVDPALSELDRDSAARTVDAFRHVPPLQRVVQLTEARWETCTSIHTLRWLSREMTNLSYSHDIAAVKDPFTTLLSKVLNSRCQTRKYGTVAENKLFESPDDLVAFQRACDVREKKRTLDDARFLAGYRAIPRRRADFKQIVLCSLLGNYPHVAAIDRHVTSAEVRALLYQRFTGPESDRWLQALLHGAPMLVAWCVREYIVHALLDQPGLLYAVYDLVQFERLRELTARAMSAMRLYLKQNITHSWASIGQPLPLVAAGPGVDPLCRCMHKRLNQRKGAVRLPKPPCSYAAIAWLGDVRVLMQPFHDALLSIAYRKPDLGVESFLMGKEVRLAAPLVPRPLPDRERREQEELEEQMRQQQADEDESERMQDSLARTMGPVRSDQANARFNRVVGDQKKASDAATRLARQDARAVAYVFTFLSPAQFGALSRLVDQLGPHVNLADVVPFFCPHFGIAEQHVELIDFMLTLLHRHRTGTLTKHERVRHVTELQTHAPHAYNLLQVAAELVKARQRTRASVIGHLCADVAAAQVDALHRKSLDALQADDLGRVATYDKQIRKAEAKTRKDAEAWGLLLQQLRDDRELFVARAAETAVAFAANPVVEETMTHLYACSVCNTVYSNVCDAHTSQRKYYRWGLRSAEYNYANDTLHCGNNKVNHLGHCHLTPLFRISLVGVRFVLEKRAFQLCSKCADVFSPSASTGECTDWDGHGMMCCRCTRVYRAEQNSGVNDPCATWTAQLARGCVCCGTITRTQQHTYIYPFDLVVCYRCSNRRLLAFVRATQGQMMDRADAQVQIRAYWVKARTNKRHAQVRKGVRAMKSNKQKNRARKC